MVAEHFGAELGIIRGTVRHSVDLVEPCHAESIIQSEA